MPTKLHLAEDALALHLLLQNLESLIDIVVTDENLHVMLLSDLTVDGPRPRLLGHWHTDAQKRYRSYIPSNRLEVAKNLSQKSHGKIVVRAEAVNEEMA